MKSEEKNWKGNIIGLGAIVSTEMLPSGIRVMRQDRTMSGLFHRANMALLFSNEA